MVVERRSDSSRSASGSIPCLTGGIEVLNALHGEQQRPAEQVPGIVARSRQLVDSLT